MSRLGIVAVLCLATALSTAASNPSPAAAASVSQGSSSRGLLALANSAASPLLTALGGLTAGTIDSGTDGRITVLLLGSDSRKLGISRTDSIMIVSLKGTTISAASIPRDTARIPNPAGGLYKGRVNALIKSSNAPKDGAAKDSKSAPPSNPISLFGGKK